MRSLVTASIQRLLGRFDLRISRIGKGFIDVEATVAEARKRGITVNEFIEQTADDPAKRGRRDRVMERLQEAGALGQPSTVCEIGPGTGRYMERILETCHPRTYEIYETHIGWRRYIQEAYGSKAATILRVANADGHSLSDTPDNSCDLVLAHAVFVYLPVFTVVGYIKEMLRVCKPGGHVSFDFVAAEDFDADAAERWIRLGHNWPVLVPRNLVLELGARGQATLKTQFTEPYGGSCSEYVVLEKGPHGSGAPHSDSQERSPANRSDSIPNATA